MDNNQIQIEVLPYGEINKSIYDYDKALFDLDCSINLLRSHADTLDYLVSIASGLLCGMLDVLWVGEFDLVEGRAYASDETDKFVQKAAHMLGCKEENTAECVKFLEDHFPLAADGNTPDFGGGLQHHLRDFAHHPTIAGLFFSLLTQFTGKSYGTDVNGVFLVVDVPEKSKIFIGKDLPTKIINGTIIWFFHLVSDMAGSNKTAGIGGGTGIPGPILSLAKEISALPLFNSTIIEGMPLSQLLSKLFNGTFLAEHDENGKIIKDTILKMDFRGELGALSELGKQALPVLANECIVRLFYSIRQFAAELKEKNIHSIMEFNNIDWISVVPINSPTLTRMLTIATGVFTTVDIADAVLTEKYFVAVNYVGVGRFAIAINGEIAWAMKRRNLLALKKMYETIQCNIYAYVDNEIYRRIENDMNMEKLGLTVEEAEILYNIEYYKTRNDINGFKNPKGFEKINALKEQWLSEWVAYTTEGFEEFVRINGAVLHWYSFSELLNKINKMNPHDTWYKIVLLEAMLFEPYYTLGTEKDKNGKEVPSKKYNSLNSPLHGFNEKEGDQYLEVVFSKSFDLTDFIPRLRKCYKKTLRELNEVLKTTLTAVSIGAGVAILATVTAGALAPGIAVALAGSNFAGLGGAALTNACLAFVGGGAVAAGGLGMAGGTAVIAGGGAILGLGAGTGAGSIVAATGLVGKKMTIIQSAKLIVSVKEIFLNEEKDVEYSMAVYERYVSKILEIEKDLAELRLKAETASKEDKKELKDKIKDAEDTVDAMKIAMKSMNKFISSYKVGIGLDA